MQEWLLHRRGEGLSFWGPTTAACNRPCGIPSIPCFSLN